jgi:MFS family permease
LAPSSGAHLASRVIARIGSRALAVAGLGMMAIAALLLAAAPDHASYVADLLPGFLLLGLGVGFVFPAASVTTMSDVRHQQVGLASGLMTTGHEIGAALGVATFSAVATAGDRAATLASKFANGYGDGFLVAAVLAVVLAAIALVTVPAVRPTGEARLAMH